MLGFFKIWIVQHVILEQQILENFVGIGHSDPARYELIVLSQVHIL